MKAMKRELIQNTLTVKVTFGEGKHGVLTLVLGDQVFQIEDAQPWDVPNSQRSFLTLDTRSLTEKKTIPSSSNPRAHKILKKYLSNASRNAA